MALRFSGRAPLPEIRNRSNLSPSPASSRFRPRPSAPRRAGFSFLPAVPFAGLKEGVFVTSDIPFAILPIRRSDRRRMRPPFGQPSPHGGKAMLVVSRKVDEAIVIAGKVRVVVAEVRGVTVRLGVQAPRDITVDREEVHLGKEALSRGPPDVFTQQEYDLLADHAGCVPETFCGRQMYVREGPARS